MSFASLFDLHPELFKIDDNQDDVDDSSKDKKIEYGENERLRKENKKLKQKVEELEKKEYLKLSDYEHIVISAVRYSLGKIDYIVKTTVNYVLQEIEYDKLSDNCLDIIRNEIENYLKNQKNLKDYEEMWKKLLNRIEEVI